MMKERVTIFKYSTEERDLSELILEATLNTVRPENDSGSASYKVYVLTACV